MTGTSSIQDRLPIAGAGFVWEAFEEALVLRPDSDAVHAAFTTRVGGASSGPFASWNVSFAVGDERECVIANRELANRAIGRAGASSWGRIKQVHSDRVLRASDGEQLREADGVWTDERDRVVGVNGGDCLPILLVGDRRIAAAHAGWRGLVAGIVEAAVRAVEPAQVWIGPGIGPCCYEVDSERADLIRARFGPDAARGRFADLWFAAEFAASTAGVPLVRSSRLCTSCHDDLFFSHRRDRGRTGRQALVARLADV